MVNSMNLLKCLLSNFILFWTAFLMKWKYFFVWPFARYLTWDGENHFFDDNVVLMSQVENYPSDSLENDPFLMFFSIIYALIRVTDNYYHLHWLVFLIFSFQFYFF